MGIFSIDPYAAGAAFAAFLRHANFSSEYSNLFFCGGTVHPGGGIPLALNGAKIVERMVREDFNAKTI